jgi:hypothetical protein
VAEVVWWVDDGAAQLRWWQEPQGSRRLTGLTADQRLLSFFALRSAALADTAAAKGGRRR